MRSHQTKESQKTRILGTPQMTRQHSATPPLSRPSLSLLKLRSTKQHRSTNLPRIAHALMKWKGSMRDPLDLAQTEGANIFDGKREIILRVRIARRVVVMFQHVLNGFLD